MKNDRTADIEKAATLEQSPKFMHLVRLFSYAFSSTKVVSCIYLGAFIFLAFLRPVLAFVWGAYIQQVEAFQYTIIPALILLVCYFVINFVADLINRYTLPRSEMERLDLIQANRQQELMYSKLYRKLAHISPEYLEIPSINDKITQNFDFVSNKNGGMNTAVMMNGFIVIGRAISVVSIAASLFIFNPWLMLLALLAPLPTIWSCTKGLKLRFKFIVDNSSLLRKANYFQNLMLSQSAKEVKVLGLHDFIYNKWKEASDEYTLKEIKTIRAQTALQLLNYGLLTLTTVAGLVAVVILLATGSIGLGAFGATLALVSALTSDMKELITGFVTVYMKKNEAAQFWDIMGLPSAHACIDNINTDMQEARHICIKNMKYRYPLTDKYVLEGVNLAINKGEKVAFVGENGSGKSTLVKLIIGSLTPSEGDVLINDRVMGLLTSNYLSIVSQDPVIYNSFTIEENVLFGDISNIKTPDDISAALDFAGLGYIDKGETLGRDIGGIELSGGEFQKLAIARATFRDKDFIILDEPTSNLDPISETELFKKYLALSKNKTVIFVTHRISVASLADRIIVFGDSGIAQDGSHTQLMAEGEAYAKLYNAQANWYSRG